MPHLSQGLRILSRFLFSPTACLVVTLLLSGLSAAQALPDCLPQGLTKLNADFRLRSDNIFNLANRNDIQRARVWLRPGFDLNPTNGFHLGARGSFALSTDQNEQNIPRFDNFHSDDISLDRLYLTLEKGGAQVCVGKFFFPFVASEMLWDRDIQPSGIYTAFHRNWLSLRAGLFYRSHIHHDRSTIVAGQITARRQLTTNWDIEVAGGFFGFHNLDEFQSGMQRQNRIRLSNEEVQYFSAFNMGHGYLLVKYRGIPKWPLTLETNAVFNFGAIDQRDAFEVAAHMGTLEKRGDWQFSYYFQKVASDAVAGAFTSDDWWYHSDHRGNRFTVAYSFLSHSYVQFGAIFQRRNDTLNWVKRFEIDLGVRF